MGDFSITITGCPRIRTAGVFVVTSMDRAGTDCPHLWSNVFGPRMDAFPADPAYLNQSFGASIMDQPGQGAFSYWAVMPIADGVTIPDGMRELILPAGTFARCDVASLAQLGAAFTHIYMEWPKTQSTYTVDMTSPSIEVYTKDFLTAGTLTILCPVIKA